MIAIVLVIQVVFPLSLLVWLAFAPAPGWLAWGLQVVAIVAVLLGMTTAMLWAMPPFWTPYVYWILLGVTVAWQLAANLPDFSERWAAGTAQTLALLVLCGLGALGAYLFAGALAGRQLPPVPVVDIAMPFPPGSYLVAHGGSTTLINGHLETLNPDIERFRSFRGQSRALDIFSITPVGFNVRGVRPREPERYTSFGTPLLAPCGGRVAIVVDGVPDNQVPTMNRDQMAGNFLAIDCGEFYLVMAHFRQGSIQVAEGQMVEPGDYLGELGNSGNSSEPHLHIHAQLGLPEEAPLGGEPIALTINGRFPVRNDRLHVPEQD